MSHVTAPGAFDKLSGGAAIKRRIRVRKSESAYVYAIFESHEGVLAYSTLESEPGAPYCDMALQIPLSRSGEADELIKRLGDLVYDLEIDSR
jgi:hypothetical protein